jgi:tripartite-type tricarboxylate transporter receptor subunit TctC
MSRVLVCTMIAVLAMANLGRAQTPYFQGKTMTIIVGTGAGDLYDLYARAIALFMGKYLPGNPNVLVQNMPGAGHMIAANYVYNIAKPDGLTMGAINAGLYFEP